MDSPIEFYFDFMSPFAYLARGRLCELAHRFNRELIYKPMDLPAAKLAAGNTGPANRDVPVKLRYLMTDINRWAKKGGLPVHFPASLDSHRMNAGTFYAMKKGDTEDYVKQAFNIGWGEGGDIGSDDTLVVLAEKMAWSPAEFLSYINPAKALPEYVQSNAEAVDKGVFGVPTVIIDEHMWWGNDRLDFVEEFLLSDAKISS